MASRAAMRAAARATPARDLPPEGERLVRGRRGTKSPYDIDPSRIPEGTSYEWKRKSVYGEPNAAYDLELAENHWKPVSAETAKKLGVLREHGGLVLMERPSYLTAEARSEDKQRSQEAVYGREMEARSSEKGQFERAGSIKRSYAPKGPEVPE